MSDGTTDWVDPANRRLRLTVRVRHRDEHEGKPIVDLLLSLYKANGISGASVFQGIRGYGRRGVARADLLGLSVNLPIFIETVDAPKKIESVLSEVKRIVGHNGLVTLDETSVL